MRSSLSHIRWTACMAVPLALVACRSPQKAEVDTFGLSGTSEVVDGDGDGITRSDDCNDNDASQFPGAAETCDGVDNNCDGQIDEGVLQTWYADADRDGFGDPSASAEACAPPSGYVSNSADCDDDAAQVYPGAPEACDDLDNDCDGAVDEDGLTTWYTDVDGDGYGDSSLSVVSCERPANGTDRDGDCDDGDAAVHPNATEVCNEVDDNCDGAVDEGLSLTWYRDLDEDGWAM